VPVVPAAVREKEKQEKLIAAFEREGILGAGTGARAKEKKEKLGTTREREGTLDASIGAPPPSVKEKSTHNHYT
jgi:hypothetical protein